MSGIRGDLWDLSSEEPDGESGRIPCQCRTSTCHIGPIPLDFNSNGVDGNYEYITSVSSNRWHRHRCTKTSFPTPSLGLQSRRSTVSLLPLGLGHPRTVRWPETISVSTSSTQLLGVYVRPLWWVHSYPVTRVSCPPSYIVWFLGDCGALIDIVLGRGLVDVSVVHM